jgi:hypothetical protein
VLSASVADFGATLLRIYRAFTEALLEAIDSVSMTADGPIGMAIIISGP